MRRTLASAFEALVDRRDGYLSLGPIYVTSVRRSRSDNKNAFTLGRDHERSQHRAELSTVASMLSAIQESMTTRQT